MKNIKKIHEKLSKINKKVYIVGGYCRDKILLGKNFFDIDLTTNANPSEIKKTLNVVKEVGKKYGTLIIKEGNEFFEITSFRKDIGILNNRKPIKVEFTDKLELDSKRRDFTFNAIYFDIENNNYIDPENGINDIKNKKIRFIGKASDRINEDALRILRFIRFKNLYNFIPGEKDYFKLLNENISLLQNISIERIKEEFEKILLLKNNIQALKDLKQIGFFKLFFPEIDNLELTPGGAKHHLEGNVWTHTLLTIKELNNIFDKSLNGINFNYSKNDKIDFYRTLLFHDIGKNKTFSKDDFNNVHYFNHENISVDLTKNILKKFLFSKKSSKRILWLIKNHMRIFKIFEMKKLKSRLFMQNIFFKDLIIIGIADNTGRIPSKTNNNIKLINFYNNFLNILNKKTFLTGKDIIKTYPNLKGIEIKKMLETKNNEILINDNS